MARDTIIDPEWEAEELRREAEREARRRPKRISGRERAPEERFRDADDDGSVAPWDDPEDGSHAEWFTDSPDGFDRNGRIVRDNRTTGRSGRASGDSGRRRVEGDDWDDTERASHRRRRAEGDDWDDTEHASHRRRARTTHDEKVYAKHAADGDANGGRGNRGGNGGEPHNAPPRKSQDGAFRKPQDVPSGEAQDTPYDEPPRRPSKVKEYIGSVLSGNILSKGEVRRLYPYLLFVAFLMLLYISNVFRMQQLHRRQETLTGQVKELRAKSLTMSALRMNSTRQSEIIKELRRRGIALEESLEPPKVVK